MNLKMSLPHSPVVRRFAFVTTLVIAAVGTLVAPTIAGAVGVGGSTPFAITPTPNANGTARGYFTLSASAGQAISEQIVVSNLGRTTETLKLGTSIGTTASNSRSSYTNAFDTCSGAACWITGLPSILQLGAGASKTLTFEVNVPPGTAPSQYLAGITGAPQNPPAPVTVGGNGTSRAQAIVVDEVTVGVAVTVGGASTLTSRLVVTKVTSTTVGTTPRLIMYLENTGQTFVHGSGTATCTIGNKTLSFPALVNTILPGGSAEVPINAAGLAVNDLAECHLLLPYGGASSASWSGSVSIPAAPSSRSVHIGKGIYETVPASHLPIWAISLFVVAGVAIIGLLVALAITRRRQRRPLLNTPTGE